MYLDYEKKVLFQCAPRCGSRSVRDVLLGLGFVEGEKPHSHHSSLLSTPGSLYTGFGARTFDKHIRHGGWTVFTVVRNHYDRLASHYRLNHTTHPSTNPDLDKIIRKLIKQGRQVAGAQVGFYYLSWTLHATRVLRYENLEQELNDLLLDLGYEGFEIPHVGKSEASRFDYRDYFSEETKALVEKEYGFELKKLGYEW